MTTAANHLIDKGIYDGVIHRRITLDQCIGEIFLPKHADETFTPKLEIALAPGRSRKYLFTKRYLRNIEEKTYLVFEYQEE